MDWGLCDSGLGIGAGGVVAWLAGGVVAGVALIPGKVDASGSTKGFSALPQNSFAFDRGVVGK